MIKFTFITLVMILGISSISFGKSYLCIPERGTLLTHNKNYLITKQSEFNKNEFHYYSMNVTSIKMGSTFYGKCEEI